MINYGKVSIIRSPLPAYIAGFSLIAAAYFALAQFGLSLGAAGHRSVSLIWPATGFALGMLLMLGIRHWPAIFAGALLANLATPGIPAAAAAAIALGNTLESVLAAYLLRNVAGFRDEFDRLRDVVGFIFAGSILSTAVSATVGIASLTLAGLIPAARTEQLWIDWWIGDMSGALLVTPFILAFRTPAGFGLVSWRSLEALTLLIVSAIAAAAAFSPGLWFEHMPHFAGFTLFPLVVWAALRFDLRGSATVALLIACMATVITLRGQGQFATGGPALLLLAMFNGVLAITGLVIAAGNAERKFEKALRRNDRLWRQVLNSLPVGVWITDEHGTILNSNPAARDIWSGQRFVGIEHYDEYRGWRSTDGSCIGAREWALARAVEKGETTIGEMVDIECFDGTRKTILNSAIPIRDDRGASIGAIAVNQDITESRQAEKRLLKLTRARAMMAKCNHILVHATDEQAMLRQMCRIAVESGGYCMAWIGFAGDDENKSVRPVAHAGAEDGYIRKLDITWADTERGRGPTGTAIRTGELQVTRDMAAAPDFTPWREDALQRGYRSSLACPLRNGTRVLGALNIYSRETGGFDTEEVALLVELADDIAFGIDSLRARAERERTQQLLASEKNVLEIIAAGSPLPAVLDAITRVMEAQAGGMYCSILLLDEDGQHLRHGAAPSLPDAYNRAIDGVRIGPKAGSCGTAAHTGKITIVSDIASDPLWADFRELAARFGLAACWSIPIKASNSATLGTLAMYHREPRRPTPADLELIEHAQHLAGIAIERVRAERALRESERFARSTIDALSQHICVLDEHGKIIAVNKAWREFAAANGTASERVSEGSDYLAVCGADTGEHAGLAARAASGIQAVMNGQRSGFSLEYPCHSSSGQRWFVLKATRFPENGALRVVIAHEDITARKLAEQATIESEERFRSIVELAPVGIAHTTLDGRYRLVNRKLCDILGYSEQELLSLSFRDITVPEDLVEGETYLDRLQRGEIQGYSREKRYIRKNGATIWANLTTSLLRDKLGRPKHYISVIEDISERKRTEAAIRTHALYQSVIADFGQRALASRDLEDLMKEAISVISHSLDVEYCRILQLALNDEALVLKAGTNYDTSLTSGATIAVDADCPAAYALRNNVTVVVEDFGVEQRFGPPPFARGGALSSGVDIIIPGPGGPLGVLAVYSSRPRKFDAQDIDFLQAVANVLAASIERKAAEQRLAYIAQFDGLTGLPNRALLRDRLTQAMTRAVRNHKLVALMFLDLDRFKEINDTLGHEIGDRVLQTIGHRIRDCLREGDTVARLGGDEFTVVLEEISNVEDASQIARKVIESVAQPIILDENEVFLTTSIGITIYPFDDSGTDELLKNADIAMYHAKSKGRNDFQFYTADMNARAGERLHLESGLRRALERREFMLHYQPQIDLESGTIVGVETLIRWLHPELGFIPPDTFIPIAEQSGLIVPIGEWVLRTACAQGRAWQTTGVPVRVSVNLSARQFMRSDLIRTIRDALAATGLDPALLELEITEGLLMENPEEHSRLLSPLKAMGVRIAIDDFGTGYSSLTYLKHFPLDVLKIDQSFVRNIGSDSGDAAIVSAVIALAHSMGLDVIAEGVETAGQLHFLREKGCRKFQGYLFSHPLPEGELTAMLNERRRFTIA